MSAAVYLTATGRTDIGRVRTNNEDAFCLVDLASGNRLAVSATSTAIEVNDRRILLALSDGMGGHASGEVASAMVLDVVSTSLRRAAHMPIEQALELAIRAANTAVSNEASAKGRRGMGATLTAVVTSGPHAWVAEVGDSRAYVLRDRTLHQLTRDQSLVQALVDRGAITPEAARTSPQKNVILQAMGVAPEIRPAIGRLALRRGDRLLLCCDGLSNVVSEAELGEILAELRPGAACDRLIDLANDRGGVDNLTAVVATFDGSGLEPPRADEPIAATYVMLREYMG